MPKLNSRLISIVLMSSNSGETRLLGNNLLLEELKLPEEVPVPIVVNLTLSDGTPMQVSFGAIVAPTPPMIAAKDHFNNLVSLQNRNFEAISAARDLYCEALAIVEADIKRQFNDPVVLANIVTNMERLAAEKHSSS